MGAESMTPAQLLQATRCERQARRATKQVALIGRELSIELIRVDQTIALVGAEAAHPTSRVVEGPAPIRWQLFKLTKHCARLVFLPRRQVLPRFHAAEHALLLLRRQAREMLQTVL